MRRHESIKGTTKLAFALTSSQPWRKEITGLSKAAYRPPIKQAGSWRASVDQRLASGLITPLMGPRLGPSIKQFHNCSTQMSVPNLSIAPQMTCDCSTFNALSTVLKDQIRKLTNWRATSIATHSPVKASSNHALTLSCLNPLNANRMRESSLFRSTNHNFGSLTGSMLFPSITKHPLTIRQMTNLTKNSLQFGNTMKEDKSGITIKINTTGYKKENITVVIENGWIIIEAYSTVPEDVGGYLQRHMVRRYELSSKSDILNIQVELNEAAQQLKIYVPSLKSKVN